MTASLPQRLVAEALGTALLVATVVGSGIMAERLAGGNLALALLCNTIATGAILVVLVTIFAPLSGAHLNPAVTAALVLRREFRLADVPPYIVAQCAGGICGTVIAHLMYGLAPIALGDHPRTGGGQWLGEAVATFALVFVILQGSNVAPKAVPWLVGLTIVAAYWFTSSTSFANPAVTLARGLTTTFAGISMTDVPAFVVAEFAGAAIAVAVAAKLAFPAPGRPPDETGGPSPLTGREPPMAAP